MDGTFVSAVILLLLVCDPFGNIPIFISALRDCDRGKRRRIILRECVIAFAVLVIAAGDRRVDESMVAAALGEPIERATPPFVREYSSFAIGGVAPLAHAKPMVTYVDASLRRFDTVWAAGGTPHCVFPITPAELLRVSGGTELVVN